MWLYSRVYVGPGRKPQRPVFSQRGSVVSTYSCFYKTFCLQLFSGYFDTTTGPKKEADSYKKIKAEIDSAGELQSDEILFLTDDPAGKIRHKMSCVMTL